MGQSAVAQVAAWLLIADVGTRVVCRVIDQFYKAADRRETRRRHRKRKRR
jgi:acyl-ACP thioesterase